jgi:heptosyltransferase-2
LSRHYPAQQTLKLIELLNLQTPDACFILLGAPQEREVAEQVVAKCRDKGITKIRSQAGKTQVSELINDIAALDLLISVDSGPLHIAAATQTPIIALHSKGTSPFSLVCPKQGNIRVVSSCGSYIADNDQVLDLSPEDVASAALATLKGLTVEQIKQPQNSTG